MASGESESKEQIIVASSRLPYQIKDVPTENHGQNAPQTDKKLDPSVSGLVTALEDSLPPGAIWIGEINENVVDEFQRLLKKEKETETNILPVPISKELNEKHRKWSNGKLWPAFHGMQEEVDSSANQDCWKSYKEVNIEFAKAIEEKLSKDTTTKVWIHDYHFFLLPKLLRERAEKKNLPCRIGFFLHIPFPTEGALKDLPYFKETMEGLLGSDSIGFHTSDYRSNFLKCCQNLKLTNEADDSEKLNFQGRTILVQAVPAGIQYSRFVKQSEGQLSEDFPEALKNLVDALDPNKKFMIGVDRLDYTKGLLQKVEAFKTLLKDHPEHEILYLQIAVPCRENEPQYKKLRKEFEEKVKDAIKFLKDSQSKIHVSYDKVSQKDLSVLYKRADVALITPLIDGLNLVALEYIACQKPDHPGVLVLSENTGAAKYLDDYLKVADPKDGMAKDIHEAITMQRADRQEKMDKLQKQVKEKLGAERWVKRSLHSLNEEHFEKKSKL